MKNQKLMSTWKTEILNDKGLNFLVGGDPKENIIQLIQNYQFKDIKQKLSRHQKNVDKNLSEFIDQNYYLMTKNFIKSSEIKLKMPPQLDFLQIRQKMEQQVIQKCQILDQNNEKFFQMNEKKIIIFWTQKFVESLKSLKQQVGSSFDMVDIAKIAEIIHQIEQTCQQVELTGLIIYDTNKNYIQQVKIIYFDQLKCKEKLLEKLNKRLSIALQSKLSLDITMCLQSLILLRSLNKQLCIFLKQEQIVNKNITQANSKLEHTFQEKSFISSLKIVLLNIQNDIQTIMYLASHIKNLNHLNQSIHQDAQNIASIFEKNVKLMIYNQFKKYVEQNTKNNKIIDYYQNVYLFIQIKNIFNKVNENLNEFSILYNLDQEIDLFDQLYHFESISLQYQSTIQNDLFEQFFDQIQQRPQDVNLYLKQSYDKINDLLQKIKQFNHFDKFFEKIEKFCQEQLSLSNQLIIYYFIQSISKKYDIEEKQQLIRMIKLLKQIQDMFFQNYFQECLKIFQNPQNELLQFKSLYDTINLDVFRIDDIISTRKWQKLQKNIIILFSIYFKSKNTQITQEKFDQLQELINDEFSIFIEKLKKITFLDINYMIHLIQEKHNSIQNIKPNLIILIQMRKMDMHSQIENILEKHIFFQNQSTYKNFKRFFDIEIDIFQEFAIHNDTLTSLLKVFQ